jgi:hypothetical protein
MRRPWIGGEDFHNFHWKKRISLRRGQKKLREEEFVGVFVATLALGSRPRQRGCKVASQKEGRESFRMFLGVQETEWE